MGREYYRDPKRDLTDSEKMAWQHEYEMRQAYTQWLMRNNERVSDRSWEWFKMRWAEQNRQASEKREIENAAKQFDALSPKRVKEAEESERARGKVQLEQQEEARKRAPWDPMKDPYSTASNKFAEEATRLSLVPKDALTDPRLETLRGNARSSIISALKAENTKDPEAVELRNLIQQYATPDEQDWLHTGIWQAKATGESPKERLLRDIYILRNQGDPSKLQFHEGQWVRPGDLRDIGSWLAPRKGTDPGYRGPRVSLNELTPVKQSEDGRKPVSYSDEEKAIYQDVQKNFHKYMPQRMSGRDTYFMEQGPPSPFLAGQLFGEEPTRAGHKGWLNAIREDAIEQEQKRRGNDAIPAGWQQSAQSGMLPHLLYSQSGESYDPRSRTGWFSGEDSAKDWIRGRKEGPDKWTVEKLDEAPNEQGLQRMRLVYGQPQKSNPLAEEVLGPMPGAENKRLSKEIPTETPQSKPPSEWDEESWWERMMRALSGGGSYGGYGVQG